jgi:hypothetical protein
VAAQAAGGVPTSDNPDLSLLLAQRVGAACAAGVHDQLPAHPVQGTLPIITQYADGQMRAL